MASRWVPNWLPTCWLLIVLSWLWIELCDMFGVKMMTFGPRLPPVGGPPPPPQPPLLPVSLKALNSAIDHQLVVTPAVSTTLMYCAVWSAKLTVSGEDVPVPVATEVKVVPSVETSTLKPLA